MRKTIHLAVLPAFLMLGLVAAAQAQPAGSATGGASSGTSSSTGAPTTPGDAPRAAPGTRGTAITQGTRGEGAHGQAGGNQHAQPLPNGQNNTSGTSRLQSPTNSATTVVPGKRS